MAAGRRILELWNDTRLTEAEKRIGLAGIICSELDVLGIKAIIVGGTATEIYTNGGYATQDIDFVVDKHDGIREKLESLGMVFGGKEYTVPGTGFSVEVLNNMLDGDPDKVVRFQTKENRFVNVIGIEDIIVDRCARRKFWGNTEDCGSETEWFCSTTDEVVYHLIISNIDTIDWDYTKGKAADAGCLDCLMSFKNFYKKHIGDVSCKNPYRQKVLNSEECKTYVKSIRSFNADDNTSKYKYLFHKYASSLLNDGDELWTEEKDIQLVRLLDTQGYSRRARINIMYYSPSMLGLAGIKCRIRAELIEKKYSDFKNLANSLILPAGFYKPNTYDFEFVKAYNSAIVSMPYTDSKEFMLEHCITCGIREIAEYINNYQQIEDIVKRCIPVSSQQLSNIKKALNDGCVSRLKM